MTNTILWALVAVLMLPVLTHADDEKTFPGIKALMTPEEYEAAGLERLSPDERAALNQFLIRYTAQDAPTMLREDKQVKQAAQEQEIVSVIKPPFSGWSGNTVFQLENGQVWQQRRRGNYKYLGSNPKVLISRNFMGFYRMELLENGQTVQVKRLK